MILQQIAVQDIETFCCESNDVQKYKEQCWNWANVLSKRFILARQKNGNAYSLIHSLYNGRVNGSILIAVTLVSASILTRM